MQQAVNVPPRKSRAVIPCIKSLLFLAQLLNPTLKVTATPPTSVYHPCGTLAADLAESTFSADRLRPPPWSGWRPEWPRKKVVRCGRALAFARRVRDKAPERRGASSSASASAGRCRPARRRHAATSTPGKGGAGEGGQPRPARPRAARVARRFLAQRRAKPRHPQAARCARRRGPGLFEHAARAPQPADSRSCALI